MISKIKSCILRVYYFFWKNNTFNKNNSYFQNHFLDNYTNFKYHLKNKDKKRTIITLHMTLQSLFTYYAYEYLEECIYMTSKSWLWKIYNDIEKEYLFFLCKYYKLNPMDFDNINIFNDFISKNNYPKDKEVGGRINSVTTLRSWIYKILKNKQQFNNIRYNLTIEHQKKMFDEFESNMKIVCFNELLEIVQSDNIKKEYQWKIRSIKFSKKEINLLIELNRLRNYFTHAWPNNEINLEKIHFKKIISNWKKILRKIKNLIDYIYL